MIFGDRVIENMYYVPPEEYLGSNSKELEVERMLQRIVERQDSVRALRESEELFREALDMYPGYFFLFDPEARFLYMNKQALQDSNLRLEDVLGKTNEDLFPEDANAQYLPFLNRTIETGQSQHVEISIMTPAAVQRELSVDYVPILGADRAVRVILGTTVDISDIFEANRTLENAQAVLESTVAERTVELEATAAELRSANEAKDRFLANMSHDLRTPLNAIIGFSHLLGGGMAGPMNEEQTKQVAMIHDAGEHLLDLVNDVLDVSRIAAGTMRFHDTTFDVRELLTDSAGGMRLTAEARGLTLAETGCPKGVFIRADRAKVRQVLDNFVGNALKFTERGGVTLSCTEAEGGDLRIEVTDTGSGIPEDRLGDIFSEFVQLGEQDGRLTDGTGLGLAIAKRIAEALGGSVSVHSELGVGSTFALVLPAWRVVTR